MMWPFLLAATLGSAPVTEADKADLRCIALFAAIAEDTPDDKEGTTGIIMYYIGRVEGRGSGLDIEAGIGAALGEITVSEAVFQDEGRRCAAEMVAKGGQIERIGNSLAARQASPSASK